MSDLFSAIQTLAVAASGVRTIAEANACYSLCAPLQKRLGDYYAEKSAPDFRLSKLLANLRHYIEHYRPGDAFHGRLLSAIGKTLLRTADYDLNIRDFPARVKARNNSIIAHCAALKQAPKKPLEELSAQPYAVTIFLATYNQLQLTKLCLQSIYKNTTDVAYEIFLIDNGGSDGSYEFFAADSRLKVIRLTENVGLLLALHIFYEAELDSGQFWLYMNNDVIVTPRWLSNMLKGIVSDPAIAAVMPVSNRTAPFLTISTPFALYDLEQIQSFGEQYNISDSNLWQDWLIMYGFVCLMRPSARRALGYYEDCFYFPYYYSDGDVIVSMIQAGYRAMQCRDTYVHHFDGGQITMHQRRQALAQGEYYFHKKYGYFPTDYEVSLPGHLVMDCPLHILFLGNARGHVLYQVLNLEKKTAKAKPFYYAADTMEKLSAEQISPKAPFVKLNSWYEVDSIFPGVKFDIVYFMEDILKMRRPLHFLKVVNERLQINGRLVFIFENAGSLLFMNYIAMAQRDSPRDACRIRKNTVVGIDVLVSLVYAAGMFISDIGEVYFHELFTYADIDTIESYRRLVAPDEQAKLEKNMRHLFSVVSARKASLIDREKSMEQILLARESSCPSSP